MSVTLLQTKLYVPPPRPDLVPRPRLIESLDSCLQPGAKLALISAPAGSGKTTLVAQWLGMREGRFTGAWLSLDTGDNDLARFLVYLAAALGHGELGSQAPTLLRPSQTPSAESFLIALINDLAASADQPGEQQPLLLVLDDYHLIQTRSVHDALAFLLEHQPPHVHLVIITRTEPPLPLARFRGRGQVLTLSSDDLRFTLEETSAFLNQAMGLALTVEEIDALATGTEGWAAGLQMAALAYRDRPEVDRPALTSWSKAPFVGSRFMMDYLLEEVLQRESPSVQTFLLQTAILECLCGPLCDAVTDQGASHFILADLERRNLFLVPLDQEQRWYRCHHLFAELLRQRLDQVQPDQIPALHRRASGWYRENGQMAEAIHHALAAGDGNEAADMVQASGESIMMQGQFKTLSFWLDELPEEVVRARPRLTAYRAFMILMSGRPLAEIEALLGQTSGARDSEMILVRAILDMIQGNLRTSKALSREAIDRLPAAAGEVPENRREEYGTHYRETASALKAAAPPAVVENQFDPPQSGRHSVLLLGNAGQRILTAGEILCLAGLTAGLHASQKNEYNITVLRGPSISELILSEEPIDYAGIERPDVILALSQEGVNRRRPLFAGLKSKTRVLQVPEITLPPTRAAVSGIDLRSLGIKPQDWALAALAELANTNRIISRDMLRAALTTRFQDDVLGSALQLVEKVYQE